MRRQALEAGGMDKIAAQHKRGKMTARERLHIITPVGKIASLHLSLSDDYPLAQAVVVISAD
jgi:phosphopantetheinyl transferase (holo-ACP synthase)